MDTLVAVVLITIFFLPLVLLYFMPTLVAYARGSPIGASIGVVNLFLGWTFFFWVVALAVAVGGEKSRGDARSTRSVGVLS